MFGKHFTSMYEGSMIGRGSCFFAVWGYVISHFVPDRKVGAWVELNPKLLGFVLGESESKVEEAIQEMCRPDPKSRTKHMDGRKLVKLGEYSYQVVNGEQYRAIRDEETRREQNRVAQQRHREKKSKIPKSQDSPPSAAYRSTEARALAAADRGDVETYDKIAAGEA